MVLVRQMLHVREATPSNFNSEMLHMEHFSLIPIDESLTENTETWLYVLEKKMNRVAFMPSESPAYALNSKSINLKEEHWLENTSPGDFLIQEGFATPETMIEHDQTRIIDTRTFTRPRKARMPPPSPYRPAPVVNNTVEVESNLNSTFNFVPGSTNGDALNATVVIEDAINKTMPLNSTFQVELNGAGLEEEEEEPMQLSPSNNNVYALNNTFDMQSTTTSAANRSRVVSSAPVYNALNATYGESDMIPARGPPTASHSLDEMDELDEDDHVEANIFRKPLLPGAVPKKMLIRTSTMNDQPDTPETPEMQISPTLPECGLKGIERIARLQEESLAQTSTPMGRRLSAFRRPVEVDHNLGSPISTLTPHEGTINYGPPIPMRDTGSISSSTNSNSPLDNSNHAIRGQLTFEKSQNSVELHSNSPTSPADSPYSSQSLESDTAGPVSSTNDSIRRSMPNLNNPSRLRLPQPSSNLNRQHGSESGLRPPTAAAGSMIRPPIGSAVNGSLVRPQFKLPPPASELKLKPPNPVQQGVSLMAPPRSSLSYGSASKLKTPQLMAPRASAATAPRSVTAAPTDDLNGTVVIEKPVVVAPAPALSGIPRPSFSKIPTPRSTATKSSIPTMAAGRPRLPQ